MTLNQALVTANDPLALAEWFILTMAVVIAVTLLYKYVLSKSPPPETLTVAKLEQAQTQAEARADPNPVLAEAEQALKLGDYRKTVELSVRTVNLTLSPLLQSIGVDPSHMNISDQSYVVQTRARSAPQITQHIYQLNALRLKALQGEPPSQQEAAWAVSVASWLLQVVSSQQIVI